MAEVPEADDEEKPASAKSGGGFRSLLVPVEGEPDSAPELELAPAPSISPAQVEAAKALPPPVANPPKDKPNPRDLIVPVGTSNEERLAVFGKSAAGGALVTSGAAMGAGIGLTIGAGFGPFAPIAMPVLGAAGTLAGAYSGLRAARGLEQQGLVIADEEKVSPGLRPYAVAGQAFGGSISGTGSVMALGQLPYRLPRSAVGNFINRLLDSAKNRPILFATTETASALSASAAEGIYEAAYPGRPLERMGVGIAAGALNPVNLADYTARKLFNGLTSLGSQVLPSARRSIARRELERILKASGDDFETMVTLLNDMEGLAKAVPGFDATLAQITGSKRLAELEKNLAELDRPFGQAAMEAGQKSMQAVANAIRLLQQTGDPDALRLAAELQADRYRTILLRLENSARVEAQQSAFAIAEGASQAERAALSQKVVEIYTRALERARQIEAELWAEVAGLETRSDFSSVFQMVGRLTGELADPDDMPKYIIKQLNRLAEAKHTLELANSGEDVSAAAVKNAENILSVDWAIKFRSGLLARARGQARSTDELADQKARQYGLVAEAVLDDLVLAGASRSGLKKEVVTIGGAVVSRVKGKFVSASPTAFDEARAYSRALNEVFTRSFVGAADQQGAYGRMVPPETLMKRAFAGGAEEAALRFKELEEATRFAPARELADDKMIQQIDADAAAMLDAQSRVLRLMADTTRNAVTGEVNPEALAKFIRNSDEVLQRFPEVLDDLKKALSDQRRVADWSKRLPGLRRKLLVDPETSAIARILKTDSVADAMYGAYSGAKPVRNLDKVWKLARLKGPQAEAGYRTAMWQMIFAQSSNPDGFLDPIKFTRIMNNPIRPGLPSLRDFMKKRGIVPPDVLEEMDKYLLLAKNIAQAGATQATGERMLPASNMLLNFTARLTGSELGRTALQLSQQITGGGKGAIASSLIVSAQGSKWLQALVERLPAMKLQTILIDAFSGKSFPPGGPNDYGLFREIAKQTETVPQQIRGVLRLHSYAWQAGLLGIEDEITDDEDEITDPLVNKVPALLQRQ